MKILNPDWTVNRELPQIGRSIVDSNVPLLGIELV